MNLDIGFVYIHCSKQKTAIYVGVTNSLKRRLFEHTIQPSGHIAKYNIQDLVYFERIDGFANAIVREKQLKGWSRKKKNALNSSINPKWSVLNDDVLE